MPFALIVAGMFIFFAFAFVLMRLTSAPAFVILYWLPAIVYTVPTLGIGILLIASVLFVPHILQVYVLIPVFVYEAGFVIFPVPQLCAFAGISIPVEICFPHFRQ